MHRIGKENSDTANRSLAKSATGGMLWKFLEKMGSQGMQIIIQIILARLLLPSEYGLVGLLSVFISIMDVVVLSGLTTALIQKGDLDETEISSVFYANVFVAVLIYWILFLIAPSISRFYDEPQLINITRVLSISVVVNAFAAVHIALLSRNLDFRKSFYRSISNTVIQGVVGITLAVFGFGPWALVYSRIAGAVVGALVLWLTVQWRPVWVFSASKVKTLFRFGSRIMATNVLNAVFNNINSLILGRFYSTSEVGYYQRGQHIPQSVMSSIDGSMTEVLFPTFSKIQSERSTLKKALRRSISTSVYVVFPFLFGLLAIARPLTLVLLGDKWLPSVPYMQLTAVICMFWPLAHRTHALNATGRSDLTLMLSLLSKGLTLAFVIISIRLGAYAIMISTICASFVSFFVTSHYVKKLLRYSSSELARDVMPSLLLSAIMAVIVLLFGTLEINTFLGLALQIVLGVFVYVVGSLLLRLDAFLYLKGVLTGFVRRGKDTKVKNEQDMEV